MRRYANRISVHYLFEKNPRFVSDRRFGHYSAHYGAFKPVFDAAFDSYDEILFVDTDVFPVASLKENIFDVFWADVAFCEEEFQPQQRVITTGSITADRDFAWADFVEQQWNCNLPRTPDGLLRVFNAGVVLYSREAREIARRNWASFDEYVAGVRACGLDGYYIADQTYLHAMVFANSMTVQMLDPAWNSFIHGTRDIFQPERRILDHRTPDSKFVHCQFPGADNMTGAQLHSVVNGPIPFRGQGAQ